MQHYTNITLSNVHIESSDIALFLQEKTSFENICIYIYIYRERERERERESKHRSKKSQL